MEKNCLWHRDNEPAVIYFNGEKRWFKDNVLHRKDGAAIEYPNGYKQWWYEGNRINCKTQEEFERWLKLKLFW
jgi:hypothetical protein